MGGMMSEMHYSNMVAGGGGGSPDPNGETIYVNCSGADIFDLTCMPYFLSAEYFQPGQSSYYSNSIRRLANGVNAASGGFGSLTSIAEFYGASLMGAVGAQSLFADTEVLSITETEMLPPGWNESWTQMYGTRGGFNWFDEDMGEWRLHSTDSWHDATHWDYNPWTTWSSGWTNVPLP
jgi:hypothetical protein